MRLLRAGQRSARRLKCGVRHCQPSIDRLHPCGYFVQKKQVILLLLCGGSKSSQTRDIARAKKMAQELKDYDDG